MTKDKLLSEKELGYKVSAENWRESYFKLMDKQAEAVKKLKEEYRLHGFKTKEFFEVIDKIMGNFNHSPQDISESPSTEDTHVKKDKGCGRFFSIELVEGVKEDAVCGVDGLCPKCEVGLKEDKQ